MNLLSCHLDITVNYFIEHCPNKVICLLPLFLSAAQQDFIKVTTYGLNDIFNHVCKDESEYNFEMSRLIRMMKDIRQGMIFDTNGLYLM